MLKGVWLDFSKRKNLPVLGGPVKEYSFLYSSINTASKNKKNMFKNSPKDDRA